MQGHLLSPKPRAPGARGRDVRDLRGAHDPGDIRPAFRGSMHQHPVRGVLGAESRWHLPLLWEGPSDSPFPKPQAVRGLLGLSGLHNHLSTPSEGAPPALGSDMRDMWGSHDQSLLRPSTLDHMHQHGVPDQGIKGQGQASALRRLLTFEGVEVFLQPSIRTLRRNPLAAVLHLLKAMLIWDLSPYLPDVRSQKGRLAQGGVGFAQEKGRGPAGENQVQKLLVVCFGRNSLRPELSANSVFRLIQAGQEGD